MDLAKGLFADWGKYVVRIYRVEETCSIVERVLGDDRYGERRHVENRKLQNVREVA
jgi:hypothetical protein